MKPKLYTEVALTRDIIDEGVLAGDVGTVVDYVSHPAGGEEGAILEIFNAVGGSVGVITVPVSAVTSLRADQVPSVRPATPLIRRFGKPYRPKPCASNGIERRRRQI